MNYDEMIALLMGGQMGYLPNDGSNYSLLMKKMYNGGPCECVFFYGISKGRAKGPWRIILFDSKRRVILENITDISRFFHREIWFECELEMKDIEEKLKIMADYKMAYDAVSYFAFQKQLDASQKGMVKNLYALFKENVANMFEVYQQIAPEFIEWMKDF